jgi:hypothetical protein
MFNEFNKIIIIFSRMQRRKGIHRTRRSHTHRSHTHRSHTHRNHTHRNRSKRIICNRTKRNRTKRNHTKRNRTKGGNYTDATTTERELVPIGTKGVVVSMPGYVFSAKEYDEHMEYMDRQGSP